jgi:hypothetical protein
MTIINRVLSPDLFSIPMSRAQQCSADLAVIRGEAPLSASKLAFPPVVRAVCLLNDLDAVILLETQIACRLALKGVERYSE